MRVLPVTASLKPRDTVAFSASAFDEWGNNVPVTPTWRITAGGGRIDDQGVFAGMSNPFEATRYHSLVIQRETWNHPDFVVSAWTEEGEIMGCSVGNCKLQSANCKLAIEDGDDHSPG